MRIDNRPPEKSQVLNNPERKKRLALIYFENLNCMCNNHV